MLDTPSLDIVCLCADWCGTCREYAQVFEALQQALPAHRYRWIDIEDEAELVGDCDVETFPTIVIADAQGVRFAGPLTPQADTLRRLLRATLLEAAPDTHWPAVAPQIAAFALRLRARP